MLSALRTSAGGPKSTAMRLTLLAATALGLYLLFFHRLTDRDLWSSHEARAAMNAQTLLDTGDWGLPALFDTTPELQKPPLYYWLVALSAAAQGGTVDALSVRLPATLSALLCLGLFLFLGFRCGRFRLGVVTALVLATALSFPTFARTGRIDMPLTLTVSVAIIGLHRARQTNDARERFGLLLAAYAAIAAGILLKGPIGLVLPAAVLLVQAVIERRLGKLGLWWGLPLVLLLTAPWFVWAHLRTDGEFTRVFFWYHNVQRGLGGSQLRAHPWWFYGPQLTWGFLPWSLLLPAAGWWCWKRKAWRSDAELRLGLIWLLTVLVVLSFARFKRADYLLPAYPGAALFLGCVLQSFGAVGAGRGTVGAGRGTVGAQGDPCRGLGWVAVGRSLRGQPTAELGNPFRVKTGHLPRRGYISQPWVDRAAIYPRGRDPSTHEGATPTHGADTYDGPGTHGYGWLNLGLTTIVTLCCLGQLVYVEWILPREEPRREFQRFARQIRQLAPQPESVTLFRTEAHTLAFHLGRPLTILVEWQHLADRLTQPGCHYIVMPPEWLEECRQTLPRLPLEEVLRNTTLAGGRHERPLVLLRSPGSLSK
jgi:Dolichyl-phosphate-mannose-protein mannosyltransferase